MIYFKRQLLFLLNNSEIFNNLNEKGNLGDFNKKKKLIIERVELFSDVFKPIKSYVSENKIIVTLIAIFFSLIINFLLSINLRPDLTQDIFTKLSLNLLYTLFFVFLSILYIFYVRSYKIEKLDKAKELFFRKIVVFEHLLWYIRKKLKISRFYEKID